MIGFFKRIKEGIAAKEKTRIDKIKGVERSIKHEIQVRKEEMMASPCAVNGMKNCVAECVHFKEGHVRYVFFVSSGESWPEAEFPKCKLWN